jgi:hypothetical protein
MNNNMNENITVENKVKRKPIRTGEHITTVQILKTTRKRLNSIGTKAQSYDDIINQLIDHMLEENQTKNE